MRARSLDVWANDEGRKLVEVHGSGAVRGWCRALEPCRASSNVPRNSAYSPSGKGWQRQHKKGCRHREREAWNGGEEECEGCDGRGEGGDSRRSSSKRERGGL
ncbi:hypothetical protein NDU88_007716 [Pleurodeles waltl]|uniref:Uncharacterized protein n=1 Tax=Pleurodeles waltl TaxID=8319 RepID=A0AAV7QMN4_PLEWA|nr:hypothetical protein NDU88_007716 [Pleurodeles waltl]